MQSEKIDYKRLSPDEREEFLRSNRIRSHYKDSKKYLWTYPFYILVFGTIVFAISSERVNQNTVFAYFTLVQGLILIPFYFMVKKSGKDQFLLFGLLSYVLLWLIEIIFFGFPNELLAAYNTILLEGRGLKPKVTFLYREEYADREVTLVFPYVYTGVKLILGLLLFYENRKVYLYRQLN